MLFTDGAYGTLLDSAPGQFADELCMTSPSDVVDAHRSYLQAGAQELQTVTFMTWRLPTPETVYVRAIKLARDALAAEASTARIVLTIGPSEDPDHFATAFDIGRIEEVDSIVVETVTSQATLTAVERAISANEPRVPLCVCVSLDPTAQDAESRMSEFVSWCETHAVTPGINCCSGAQPELSRLTRHLRGHSGARLVPSAGLGEAPQSPNEWAGIVRELADDLENPVVGGCCGTSPTHIKALSLCGLG